MMRASLVSLIVAVACNRAAVAPDPVASCEEPRWTTTISDIERQRILGERSEAVLLSGVEIQRLNERNAPIADGYLSSDFVQNPESIIASRLRFARTQLTSGAWRELGRERMPLRDVERMTSSPQELPASYRWRRCHRDVVLHCLSSTVALHSEGNLDTRVDRNACSECRAGERVLEVGGLGEFSIVATHNTWGFVPTSNLSESIGVYDGAVLDSAETVPFTARNVAALALDHLNQPYRFGGVGTAPDCSGLVQNVFEKFGILLPRNSAEQLRAGSRTIDLRSMSPLEKKATLRTALRYSVVLVGFPGHVMILVGENEQHELIAVHALLDARRACLGRQEVVPVERVILSPLAMAAGSSSETLLARLQTAAVFDNQR